MPPRTMSAESLRSDPVAVIACGGSIESRIGEDGLKTMTGNIDQLLEGATSLVEIPAQVHRFVHQPSYSLQVEDLIRLALLARGIAAEERAVVTCGTDLLEEVAFVLDLLAPDAGVVVTGAVGDSSPLSDGMPNLASALQVARSTEFPRGCAYVSFAGAVRLGRDTVETGVGEDPFRGSPRRPVGYWSQGALRAEDTSRCRPLPPIAPPADPGVVLLVSCHTGLEPSFVGVDEAPVVVVQGFGAGNVPPALAPRLEERLERGAPVILCAAAPGIPVRQVSAERGGGASLLERGALPAGRLTARKASLLAALCFRAGDGGGGARFSGVVDALET